MPFGGLIIEMKVNLMIDLDFESFMNQKELKSTSVQLGLVYSVNRKFGNECKFVGFGKEIEKFVRNSWPEFEKWTNVEFRSNTLDQFLNADCVYLTGNSDNELTDLDDDHVYIIGGIVDHNKHKNLCLNKAQRLGIKHAKLPIDKYLDLKSGNILTFFHVVEILLRYSQTKDWHLAFTSVIPQRKISKVLS